ncbi:hypothetical protein Ahy_B01g055624 [Arachis hypogaea]|uniref:Uncharacterized protein n=1 Tax=Arachis hypogaea TaxID=3818 RepID=A0A445AWN6_ARAHY|nr:hypothetical protein Ahy_B01g055624 [Arachis hypogaea]
MRPFLVEEVACTFKNNHLLQKRHISFEASFVNVVLGARRVVCQVNIPHHKLHRNFDLSTSPRSKEYNELNKYLKPADVVVVAINSSQGLKGLSHGVSGSEGNAQVNKSLHSLRPIHAEAPSSQGSPVMSNHKHLLLLSGYCIQQPDEVSHDVEARVGARAAGCIAVTEAAEVGGHAAVPSGCKEGYLVAPRRQGGEYRTQKDG